MHPRTRHTSIPAMITTALQHQQAGRLHEAMATYRRILKTVPDLPEALSFLGLARHQSGKSTEGIRLMRKAVVLQPVNAIFHNNLGFVLAATGDFLEAERHHREAVRLQAGFAEAWYNLGLALQNQNKLDEAVNAYMKAVELRPNYPKVYVNLAGVLQDLGRFKDSQKASEAALQYQPGLIEAFVLQIHALIEMDRFDEAEKRACEALKLHPDNPQLLVSLGKVLSEVGRPDQAIAALQKAASLDSNGVGALTQLGILFQVVGNHKEAGECFLKALDINPGFTAATHGLAQSRKFSAEDRNIIEKLERALATSGRSVKDKINLHFALGKIYDDCGQYDDAFAHYEAGNALKKQTVRFDRNAHKTYIDDVISVFSEEFINSRAGQVGHESDLPVFIVGMPRSGTTLVEQIIGSHPAVKSAGELPYLRMVLHSMLSSLRTSMTFPLGAGLIDKNAFRDIAQEYLDKLPPCDAGQIRITDKLLTNYLLIGLIALLFKNARIIHCRRDPMDTCLSIFFQHFSKPHPYAYDLDDLGFCYRQYDRLMQHWRHILGGRLHEVDYSHLIENQESASRKLIEYCGLEWNDQCLVFHKSERPVKTASQWQVRQPIYKSSLRRWKHYEKYLGTLKNALGL